jgi:thiamine biosynthesis protein ThiS
MILVGDKEMIWQPGMTLAQVMESLEEGQLYAVVRLNGKVVSRPAFDNTQVPDGAEILLLPLIAGG